MLERYSFIPVFTLLMGGAAWWSTQIGSLGTSDIGPMIKGMKGEAASLQTRRRELVEFLDRAVSFQRYYHSFYGKYSSSFSRMGLLIPPNISQIYHVKITEADHRRFLILATLQEGAAVLELGPPISSGGLAGHSIDQQKGDVASIDQDYKLQANFKTPPPRASYLKVRAIKHLRALRDSPAGQGVEEQGVYKNFFKYTSEVLTDLDEGSSGETPKRTVSARGLRPPVAGVFLEMDEKHLKGNADLEMELTLLSDSLSDTLSDHLFESEFFKTRGSKSNLARGRSVSALSDALEEKTSGQSAESGVLEGNPNEQVKFAQEVFFQEIGRYAKSWSELVKIVRFDADQHPVDESIRREESAQGVPFYAKRNAQQPQGVHRTISHIQVSGAQKPSVPGRHPHSPRPTAASPNHHGLEIEQVEFDELEQ